MNEEFYIGQIFEGIYPPEAANWCNANNAMIVELDSGEYEIVAVPGPTDEEIQERVRAQRNTMLDTTDKYVSVPDFPIDESTRKQYIEYRQYLRDYTKSENWWLSAPMDFDTWAESGSENVAE